MTHVLAYFNEMPPFIVLLFVFILLLLLLLLLFFCCFYGNVQVGDSSCTGIF